MPEPVRRLPFVLLGLLTVATFAGPFVIFLVLRGGTRPGWPPDRPVEWAVFWGVCGVVAVLMVACLGLSLRIQGQLARAARRDGGTIAEQEGGSIRSYQGQDDAPAGRPPGP